MAEKLAVPREFNVDRKTKLSLGNIALQVIEYVRDENSGQAYAVRGNPVNLDQPEDVIEIGLMSAARAANLFKSNDAYDDRKERFANAFADRRGLDEFGNEEGRSFVSPGGVIMMNDVRIDVSNQKLYARSAYGAVQDPHVEHLVSGHVELRKFEGDKGEWLSLSVLKPEQAFQVTDENIDKIDSAFARSVFGGNAQTARFAAVSVDFQEGVKTFPLRSVRVDDGGDQAEYSNGAAETLKKGRFGRDVALGVAVVAAAVGMPLNNVQFDFEIEASSRQSLETVYEAVAEQKVQASLTPGYAFPLFKKYQGELIADGRFIDRGFKPGVVAVRTATDDVGELSHPTAKFIQANSPVPRNRGPREEILSLQAVGKAGFQRAISDDQVKVRLRLSNKDKQEAPVEGVDFRQGPENAPNF